MSPTCLVLYSPMLTTVDTETFMTTIKNQSQGNRNRGMNVRVCAQLHTYLRVYAAYTVYIQYTDSIYCWELLFKLHYILAPQEYYCMNTAYIFYQNVCVTMCAFQDVSCWEAAKHQPSVPDHWCQGNVFVVWPQAATTGWAALYPFTQLVKIEHRVTLPFCFPVLHPSPLWQGFKLSIQGHTPKEFAAGPPWTFTGEQ